MNAPPTPEEAVENLCNRGAVERRHVPMGDDQLTVPLSVLIGFAREQRLAGRREGEEKALDDAEDAIQSHAMLCQSPEAHDDKADILEAVRRLKDGGDA